MRGTTYERSQTGAKATDENECYAAVLAIAHNASAVATRLTLHLERMWY